MRYDKLGNLCEINIGRTPSRSVSDYWGEGYSWLSIADMNRSKLANETKEQITEKAIIEANMKIVPKGTLLFSFKLSIGKVCIADKDIFTNEAIAALPIKDENILNKSYLYHALQVIEYGTSGDRAVKGVTLNKQKLKELKLPLPPLPEQKRIAQILDKADALRQKNKQLLAAYDELLQATFLDMFGDPVTNPKGWEKKELGSFGDWKSGGTPLRSKKEYYEGQIPWLSSGELENMYVSDSNEHITEKAIAESAAKKVEIGSLLLGMYDTAALKSSISKETVTCNQAIAFAKLDDTKINTVFAYTQIQLGKEFFRSKQRGVRQKNLNLSMIKGLQLLYPPITLQNQFARIVENIEAQKDKLKKSMQESDDLFGALVQKAFANASVDKNN